MIENKDNVRYLKGVGPKKELELNNLGIYTINELIFYYPRDYEDRTKISKISQLEIDDKLCVEGKVITKEFRRIRNNLSILKILISDETGHMNCIWFNQNYLNSKIQKDKSYIFYGKIVKNGFIFEFNSPVFSNNRETFLKIVPIYKKNSNITQNYLRKTVLNALENNVHKFQDSLSDKILKKYNLIEFNKSITNIHFPETNELFFKARKRLVFEELFYLQLILFKIKDKIKISNNELIYKKDILFNKLEKKLPFKLTNAQTNVIEEVTKDLYSNKIMNRLVQGDVGSGKTIIAIAAILKTFENNYQSAFMAPTEILAKQHYNYFKELLNDFNINIVFLSGSISKKEKEKLLIQIKNNECNLVIGTHAIIQKNVLFYNLGLVITDEQHRFGVDQRKTLSKKGDYPNSLVMTATPIPRTLALILYGDLDISIIDEMPVGRIPIETYVVNEGKRNRINDFIKKRVEKKEQVFIICPSIEKSEKLKIKNVNEVFENTTNSFIDYNVQMIHGKMKTEEKDKVMKMFKMGEIDILVSTTVIEVGVDIENATLMIIENADRFGIAQLHQLRGRVGRSNKKSYCILYNDSLSKKAINRLEQLEKSNDGFYLSEQDLILRGPGEFFGTKQHGIPELKIANLYTDIEILKEAQQAASNLMKNDYALDKEENKLIKKNVINKLKQISID